MDIINKLNKKGNVTMEDILYHGSKMIVSEPEIRKSRFTKDFSWGFYCTNRRKQAEIWSVRHCETGYVSVYKQLAKFKHPTHQISFHTIKALSCLEFLNAEEVHDEGQ